VGFVSNKSYKKKTSKKQQAGFPITLVQPPQGNARGPRTVKTPKNPNELTPFPLPILEMFGQQSQKLKIQALTISQPSSFLKSGTE